MRPGTNRSHLKSRSGCIQCKTRKVKCDESPGSCGACLKRGTRCSLKPSTPQHSPKFAFGVSSQTFGFLDVELLHNFTTKTCLSVSKHVALQQFYRTTFVTEALKADWLLHCILGLSAFHLAQQHQEIAETSDEAQKSIVQSKVGEYLEAANVHHNISLSSFRLNLDTITPDNCHALFGCSCIIIMTYFAQSCAALRPMAEGIFNFDAAHACGSTMVKWLVLVRGITAILAEAGHWIRAGPMAPIILVEGNEGYDQNIGQVDPDTSFYLESLAASIACRSDSNISDTCLSAIALLRKSFAAISCGCDFSVVFAWPAVVPPAFVDMLESNQPEALVVLASFCVLLHTQNWRWWIEGWSSNMLKAIGRCLDDDWMPWLSWPLHVVGNKEKGAPREHILFVSEGICCQ